LGVLGLKISDLFPSSTTKINPNPTASGGLTLKNYADAKKLPVDFFESFPVREWTYCKKPAIRLAYLDEHGDEQAVRYRTALDGKQKFKWRTGDKPFLYCLWLLP